MCKKGPQIPVKQIRNETPGYIKPDTNQSLKAFHWNQSIILGEWFIDFRKFTFLIFHCCDRFSVFCIILALLFQVKDNPELLKKSMKKEEKLKSRSKKKWEERREHVAEQQQKRQDKRKKNIAAKKQGKVERKMQQAKKKGRMVSGF